MEPWIYVRGDLAVEVSPGPETVLLVWRGRSNDRAPVVVLAPLFDRALEQAERGSRGLELHFGELEELNSSTLTAILLLVRRLKGSEVTLTLTYDPRVKWQKLSFEPMRVLQRQGNFALRPLGAAPAPAAQP